MLAACAVSCLLCGLLLKMLVLDFGADAFFLFLDSLLELLSEFLRELLELRLMVVLRLLESLCESLFLGFLLADVLSETFGFVLHLVFIGSFLDVWVVALLVLSCLVVHLLEPVALCVGVRSCSGRPVDVVDFGKGSLCVFDGSDDFAVLVSGTAEADRHTLAVEPRQNTGKHRVDGTERGQSNTRSLLVCRQTRQCRCDQNL